MNAPNDFEALAEAAWMDASYTNWSRGHRMGPSWYRLPETVRRENVELSKTVFALHEMGIKGLAVRGASSEIRWLFVEKLIELVRGSDLAKAAENARKVWNPEVVDLRQLRVAHNVLRAYVDTTALGDIDDETIFEQLIARLPSFFRDTPGSVGFARPKTLNDLRAPFGWIVDNMLKGRPFDYENVVKGKSTKKTTEPPTKQADPLLSAVSWEQLREIQAMKPDVAFALVETLRALAERNAQWDIKNFDVAELARLAHYVAAVQTNKFHTPINAGRASEFITACIAVVHREAIWKLARLAYGQVIARASGEWNKLNVEEQNRWCELTRDIVFAPILPVSRIIRNDPGSFKRSVLDFTNQYFSGEITKAARDWHEKPEGRETTRVEVAEKDKQALRQVQDSITMRAKPGVNDEVLRRVSAAEEQEYVAPCIKTALGVSDQTFTNPAPDSTLTVDALRKTAEELARSSKTPREHLQGISDTVSVEDLDAKVAPVRRVSADPVAVYDAQHPDDVHYFPGAPDDIRNVTPAMLGYFAINNGKFQVDSAMIEGSPLLLRLFPNEAHDIGAAFNTRSDLGVIFRSHRPGSAATCFKLTGLFAIPDTYTCQPDGATIRETILCQFDKIESWNPKQRDAK